MPQDLKVYYGKIPEPGYLFELQCHKKGIHHRRLTTIYIVLLPYNNISDFWKKYMKDFLDILYAVVHGFLLCHIDNIIT